MHLNVCWNRLNVFCQNKLRKCSKSAISERNANIWTQASADSLAAKNKNYTENTNDVAAFLRHANSHNKKKVYDSHSWWCHISPKSHTADAKQTCMLVV